MKVHFIGPLEGDQQYYKSIIKTIKDLGYKVITNHSATRDLNYVHQEPKTETELYVQKMQNWIRKSDIVVVDVTYPGFGAGFEIAIALQYGKPVVVIYQPNPKSGAHTVLKGINFDRLQVLAYAKNTLKQTLNIALKYASEQVDTRFTMVLPADINSYLNQLGQKGINRSEYIRSLIREKMEEK
ncbi:hypothetical protein GYA49_01935 [Candidatus Beckwithbacteria bacterium]|nr:hypothetical protein [Candidatus Beckwithbacteria bacterium]